MNKIVTKTGRINIVILSLYIFCWVFSFLNIGIISSFSWVALKLFLPFAGIAMIIWNLILLVIRKYRYFSRCVMSIVLGIIYILPLLLTMNVVRIAYPADINTTTPSVSIASPFKSETIVAWGGNEIENNLPHAGWSSERWAYDIVMHPYDTGDADLESYGIWNQEVYAPADGIVVAAYDQDNDILPNQDEFESSEGNHVYIQIEESGTYLLLNHLKKDSVTVKAGDKVSTGDLIGAVGNSGTSSEPHLHIHHQKENPTEVVHPVLATGLPLYFEVSGEDVMPVKGDVLSD